MSKNCYNMDVLNRLAIIGDSVKSAICAKNVDVFSLSEGRPVDLMPFLRQVLLSQNNCIAFCVGGNALEVWGKIYATMIQFLRFANNFANLVIIGVPRVQKASSLTKLSKHFGKRFIGLNVIGKTHLIYKSHFTLEGTSYYLEIGDVGFMSS